MRPDIPSDLRNSLINIFTPYHLSAPCPLTERDLVTAAFNEAELEARETLNIRHGSMLKRYRQVDFRLEGFPTERKEAKFSTPIRYNLEKPTSFPEQWFSNSNGEGLFPVTHPKNDVAMAWMVETERINKELFLIVSLAAELARVCGNFYQMAKLWPDIEPWLRKLPINRDMLGTQLGHFRSASSSTIRNSRAPYLNSNQAAVINAAKPVLAKIHLLSGDPAAIKVRNNQRVVVGRI